MNQARSRLALVISLIVALPLVLAGFSWWALRPADPAPLLKPTAAPSPASLPTSSPSPTSAPTGSTSSSASTTPIPAPTPSPTPSQTPSPTPVSQQRTLLLQLRGMSGAPDSVIIGIGGGPAGAEFIYAPAGLLVDVPAEGVMTLADATVLPDTRAASVALSTLLGVRLDGAFVLDRLAFAGLVDAVNGVPVIVERPMFINDDKGRFAMVIPEGARTLSGPEAAYYVMYLGTYESESARMARFADVLEKVIAALPEDPVRMGQILTSLGSLARSTIPNDALVDRLEDLRTDVRDGGQRSRDLPTDAVLPAPARLFTLELARSAALMRRMLPEAVLAPGATDPIRVIVRTGAPDPDLGTRARDTLAEAGFAVITGGSSTVRGRPPARTVIDVPPGSPQLREQAVEVGLALGVVPLIVTRPFAALADLRVTLGADAL